MIRFPQSRWLKTRTYFNDSPPPPPVPPTVPPPPPPGPTMFTQEQVNKMMADHKKQLQTQNQELITQLETLKQSAGLTQQEKDDLQTRIDGLTSQHQSETQRLQSALDKANKEGKEKLEAATGQANHWQGEYGKLLIKNAIAVGCAEHKAADQTGAQLTAMLLPQAKVVEVVGEDGKGTGVYEARLPIAVLDKKTNKPTVVELPVVEAIGKMREDPKNANLFLVDGKPGFGGNNNGFGGNGGKPAFDPKMPPSEYRKNRDKIING